MKIIDTIPESNTTSKVAAKHRAKVKLVRKMDRILRSIPLGHNPLHHHPNFNADSYHYSDIATTFGLTYSQVQKIDKYSHNSENKKHFVTRVCKLLAISPKLVDSRWEE